jgi:glyoxylase-like metal-dependent hydrolase (beta-lactamase superfamily II)
LPVPEGNITTLGGGETLHLGGRTLRVYDAPGHASHHVIYFDESSGAAFVGDNGGVRMPVMSHGSPATPPPDIDLEAWGRTLDILRSLAPSVLMVTHFGLVPDPAAHVEDYRARLARWAEFVRDGLASGADEATQIVRLRGLAEAEAGALSEVDRQAFLQAAPIDQCWQGLARYWRKRADLT